MFDKEGGRTIFFEGTYTHTFSGNPDQTPRYDYNQIMYQLDLDDPRLALPVAIYKGNSIPDRFATRAATKPDEAVPLPDLNEIAFFALDQPGVDTVAVCESETAGGHPSLIVDDPPTNDSAKRRVRFHALAVNSKNPPASTVPLYEYIDASGDRRVYATDEALTLQGFVRQERPICRVWPTPGAADPKADSISVD